ncbi:nucleotide exchange factor GrpE [Zoogloea sp.]|uniref:nucleotide exchange factor GrpE n=1 Tax=Zoogloea sp. TaxID=49181 RepID=UPI002603EEE3|nr:nucleotide exchange factor GrpE [uncultured Zoogloea sp.]MCK6387995.1 nucleotide exchange factor GrpE [Zoogloea sp.]
MQDQTPPPSPAEHAAPELVENVTPPASAEAPVAEEQVADILPSLTEQLRQTELKAAEHHDAWLRAKAETENVRRRAQDDIAKAGKFAADKFAQAMLPVKDSLEAALATDNATLESLKQGVELTLKQLVSAFQSANVTEVNPLGEKFDPNKHQAISAVEADGEPNTVINVLQKGYLLHERTIRPALVVVSKAKPAA